MKYMTTEGKTHYQATNEKMESKIHVSIVSKRGARFLITQSKKGLWKYPVIPFCQVIPFGGGYVLCGFQPRTGWHIAYKRKWSVSARFRVKA